MYKRQSWLDDAKCIGIICVVLGHIIGFFNEDSALGSKWVQGVIVSFNMPLFFMLSGYTFNLCRDWKNMRCTMDYCIKSTKRLLLPAVAAASILWAFGMTHDLLNTFWFLNILWRILLAYAISLCLSRILFSKPAVALWGGKSSLS